MSHRVINLIAAIFLFSTSIAFCQTTETLKLLAPDGATGDNFGRSVDIEGNLYVIGSPFDDDNGVDSGSVYIYSEATSSFTKITPSDGATGDRFGWAVAISGSYIVVGTPHDDDMGASSGSAYIFDTSGNFVVKLLPGPNSPGINFGIDCDIDGDVVIVGAHVEDGTGAAYLFESSTGDFIAKLTPPDGNNMDWFGLSVAISGEIAVVGARRNNELGAEAGSVYLFDATDGSFVAKINASDGDPGDWFGFPVVADGGYALIGASMHGGIGAAYLFDITTGTELTKFVPSDGNSGDQFGSGVGLDCTTAVVGAWRHNSSAGAAYVFDTESGLEIKKLVASDAASDDEFSARSVSVSKRNIIVGSRHDDNSNGTDAGSVYFFEAVNDTPCNEADFAEPYGILDLADITAFTLAFEAEDPIADLNGDAYFDLEDITIFTTAYKNGCPCQ